MLRNVAHHSFTPVSPASLQTGSTQTSPSAAPNAAAGPTVSSLKTELGDKQDLKTLGEKLQQIATSLGESATAQSVSSALKTTPMDLHPDSSHPREATPRTTVAAFIQSQGLPLPTEPFSLTGLAKAVTDRSMEHPLGNLGGALSWPVPLSADEQRRLHSIAMRHAHHLGDSPQVAQTRGGILPFLALEHPLPAETLGNPAKLLDALLTSPQAQLMGKALQEGLQGLATPTSDTDYLLAAIAVQMDPESVTAPKRNTVAGFDLAGPQNLGKSASDIVQRFTAHLVSQGKTTPAMAGAAAHLLLAGSAPVFLIKDIPGSVTYGSPAWLNLAVAAATIENQTPGKLANMTYGQVMLEARSARLADPAATETAQKAALLDWGVANGVVAKKEDSLYSDQDLATLISAFDGRNTLMTEAATHLAKDLPLRREMALAQLKQRFPGHEDLFEGKVISITTRHDTYTEGGKGVGHGKLLTGLHSMLDVAMMDLKHPDLVFHSKDSRIPLAQMNAEPHFGVSDEFEQQFDKAIDDRKTSVGTVIKHLIAQLPLEDRQNFEYGEVSFFQQTAVKLGGGFTDKTQLPNKRELLVSIKRNGVTTAYEIDVNKGAIKPAPTWQATERESRSGSVVHQTKAFAASDSSALQERTPSTTVPDSFASTRTQVIADTFIKHLDLDNPDIKAQARGITTEDRRQGLADGAGDFLLNLIPFRSAIVNFQQGNYGEGAFDLALDVFGFLTAGVGTAGKAVKVGSSAVSTVTKTLRIGRVIGAAVINQLNPLSGFGDLVAGGISLTGKGLKFASAKGVKAVNTLRGATGSYDLLKAASKTHQVAATGVIQIAGQSVEGAAVLKGGKWYAFDADTGRAYGLPLKNFTPAVAAHEGEIKALTDSWLGQLLGGVLAPPVPNPNFLRDFRAAIAKAKAQDNTGYIRGQNSGDPSKIPGYSNAMNKNQLKRLAVEANCTPEELGSLVKRIDTLDVLPDRLKSARESAELLDADAFKRGYDSGRVEHIKGYAPSQTAYELAELAIDRTRTPEEVGQLIRYMENKRIQVSLENFKIFNEDIVAAGGRATPLPQGFYLSQVSLLSEGECAALSNAMALAVTRNKQDWLIENLFVAMVPPLSPKAMAELAKTDPARAVAVANKQKKVARFREHLNSLQELLGTNFHLGRQSLQVPYTEIISELSRASISKTLLIKAPGHGITAGVVVTGGKKEWWYFDPNYGRATFQTQEAMSSALESTLKNGRTKSLLGHYGANAAIPEYKVSVFDPVELRSSTQPLGSDVADLFNTRL